jgi:ribonuclease E
VADRNDQDTTATEGTPVPDESPTAENAEVLPEAPVADAAEDPAEGAAGEPVTDAADDDEDVVPAQADPSDDDEEADGEAEAAAAALALGAPTVLPSAPQPDAEPEMPRFGAQFSSPEPTTVTARPRRRATRPALAADPDSIEPAAAHVAPAIPAFVTFVAP